MDKYKIVVKGYMQSIAKYELHLNELYRKGYRAVNMTRDANGRLVTLVEKKS